MIRTIFHLFLLCFLAFPSVAQEQSSREATLIVGRVSGDPIKTLPRLQAMADFMAARLGALGIESGGAVVANSNAEMIHMLRDGRVDLVSETVLSALRFEEAAAATILMREWKKGVPSYRSVFIAGIDSGIDSLEDLRGRVVAFEDRGSTSGFLAPLAMLREAGLTAVELSSPEQRPAADEVGYIFTDGEINIAVWVARSMADAGAFSDLDWEDTTRAPEALKANLRTFHTSAPILRSVLLSRAGLDPALASAISDLLSGVHDDPAAKDILDTYYSVTRYDPIGDVDADMRSARALYELAKDQL
ncbi:MAG: phosphate/phosphite/phosphonate ABC transporter substrate-binding protein [Inquilinaceae bacterium]